MIKYFFIGILLLGMMFSCKEKKTHVAEKVLIEEDIESIIENSQLNLNTTDFEGIYKGIVKGKEVELKLMEDYKFELKEGNRKFTGDWERLEDGTRIELVSGRNSPQVSFYARSDDENWIALDKEGAFLEEEEEFITRTDQ